MSSIHLPLWHAHELLDSPDNPMAAFPTVKAARKKLPVTYTDEEIATSSADVKGKTEMEALIAYLQGLGTAIKKRR